MPALAAAVLAAMAPLAAVAATAVGIEIASAARIGIEIEDAALGRHPLDAVMRAAVIGGERLRVGQPSRMLRADFRKDAVQRPVAARERERAECVLFWL